MGGGKVSGLPDAAVNTFETAGHFDCSDPVVSVKLDRSGFEGISSASANFLYPQAST
jgi:hypothetical protein